MSREELELEKIERIIETQIMANLSRDNLDTAIKQAAKVILTWHKQQLEEEEQKRYWSPCEGCKDGHPSFWKTVTESPQWKLWQKEQSRRVHLLYLDKLPKDVRVYDMPEVEECGWISQEHFQEFMEFISAQREVELLEEVVKKMKTNKEYWGHSCCYVEKLINERMVG